MDMNAARATARHLLAEYDAGRLSAAEVGEAFRGDTGITIICTVAALRNFAR